MEEYINHFGHKLMEFAPKAVAAFIVLILGLWAIKLILKFIAKIMKKRDVEISVGKFLYNLINWALRILLFIIVISKLGIPTTSFIAMIGAAGLAVGLALQGSLANFAGGILIIVFKPFKVGDYVSAQDVSGTVRDISIFTTRISTDTNQMAVIPNGKLSNDKVINYSILPHRREMMNIDIGYEDNIKKAKDVILELAMNHPKIIKDGSQPMPMIMVSSLGESSIVLSFRYWTVTSDFWEVRWWMLENVKSTLDLEGISIPYPQQDVHVREFPNNAKA